MRPSERLFARRRGALGQFGREVCWRRGLVASRLGVYVRRGGRTGLQCPFLHCVLLFLDQLPRWRGLIGAHAFIFLWCCAAAFVLEFALMLMFCLCVLPRVVCVLSLVPGAAAWKEPVCDCAPSLLGGDVVGTAGMLSDPRGTFLGLARPVNASGPHPPSQCSYFIRAAGATL